MSRQAIVRTENGNVENVVIADKDFDPGDGRELVDAEDERVNPGWTWDGTAFIEPDPEPIDLWNRPGAVDSETAEVIGEQFRAAGSNAIQAEQSGDTAAFMRAVIQMEYLQYVALTGDRIESVEDTYFQV